MENFTIIFKKSPIYQFFYSKIMTTIIFKKFKFLPKKLILLILFLERNTKEPNEIFGNTSFVDMKSSKIN
jgi:hypothetical protein